MLFPKFNDNQTSGPGEEDFKGFYHIWAWRPSWPCDQDYFYNLMSSLLKEAPHKNWP